MTTNRVRNLARTSRKDHLNDQEFDQELGEFPDFRDRSPFALSGPCSLCGGEANGTTRIFSRSDSRRWCIVAGQEQTKFYMLCARCDSLFDRLERIEHEIYSRRCAGKKEIIF